MVTTTSEEGPTQEELPEPHGLAKRLPRALNPAVARADAVREARRQADAAETATETVRRLADVGGLQVEVDSPSAPQLEARARAEASWRVAGNWLLLALFLSVIVLAVSFFVDDASFGADYAPYFSALIWLLVVPWIVCQAARLLMIVGSGRSKIRVGADASD